MLAERGGLSDADGDAAVAGDLGAARGRALETGQDRQSPGLREEMASRRHPDPGRRASIETQAHPGHSAARARLALKAVVFGLLLNGCDRQAGLRDWRIGREIVRTPEGNWILAYRQGKTGKIKDNGALWAPVSAIIDRHVLGDRPVWALQARVAEIDGKHLFALGPEPIGTYSAGSASQPLLPRPARFGQTTRWLLPAVAAGLGVSIPIAGHLVTGYVLASPSATR